VPDLRDRLQASLGDAYTVERELGGGGMARVFVASHLVPGERVAVKVLAPALAACCDDERFRLEMRLAAGLRHPHIVPMLGECESCDTGDALLYFIMPYVEGETLQARVAREGPLPVAESVRLLREIASALAHAHRRGIVHRDVKPANVLLSNGHALVADFGVAKAIEAAARDVPVALERRSVPRDGGLTSAGHAIGTPAYMAPEQALGDPATDHRADLYALGAVAYEMLTGAPPFGDRSPRKLLVAHVSEAPVPPSRRRDGLPSALDSLVLRLLEKRPEDRPTSAEETLRQLDAIAG
jgi:serine/threonine-protein kinase